MKKKIVLCICIFIFAALISVFFILQHNSETITLNQAGVDTKSTIRDVETIDFDNGHEFKVIQCSMEDGKLAIVHLRKNDWGFWEVHSIEKENELNYAEYIWVKDTGYQLYSPTDTPIFGNEYHYVYCGNNALKLIKIAPEQLPDNVTLNVQQLGEFYLIHMFTYEKPQNIAGFNVIKYLQENGFIPK